MNIKLYKLIFLFITLLIFDINISVAQHRQLLIITNHKTNIAPLTKNEIKQLFLGVAVYRAGKALTPLINKKSDFCYQVFLQSALGMSHKRYERVLVSSLYRQGVTPPKIHTDINELLLEIKANPTAISFIFKDDIPEESKPNIVQEIWTSGTN